VHLRRSIGTRKLDHLDPFLLLDHFESARPADYQAGFPYHPHRGIETVTIVRKGEVQHRDSLEHHGSIGAGDIQWMTSGSGIMHEEMPQVRPEGIAGLQLWLNLPARDKMTRPKYRDLQAAHLAETALDGGANVRVIAGEAAGGRLTGPVEGLAVAPKFVDVTLPPGTTFRESVPRGHTAFAYVDHGDVRFGPEQTPAHAPALVVFSDGDLVEASAGAGGGRFLLAAARPLHEPIARYGPFVMNTRAEIEQTLADLRTGHFIRDEPRDE
jgi:quercetin 2,3-dioxygenase